MADGVAKVMPRAVPDNYSFTTTRGYWSAVAVRPSVGADSDLALYNDAGLGTLLGSSGYGGTLTDFVAINSNSGARPLQTYYPRVTAFSGTTGYTILGAQGSTTFSSGATTATTGSNAPFTIMDSYQTTGVPVYYRAVPAAGQTLGLAFLQPGGTIVSRSGAVNGAAAATGQPASLVVTPSATGYGGLVVLNDGLSSGTVALYADTTAPTGNSVVVNNGAVRATKQNVTLTTASADADTGVVSMQVSLDGTFDTEAVVPYATTVKARLAGPNGVKTVYVRYLNNAGMWSAPVSDTITLNAAPTVGSLTPSAGPAGGGTSVTIRGTFMTGATAVKFGTANAASFTVLSDTAIRAITPAGTGVKAVTVTTPAGTVVSTGADRYTFLAAPTITGISPTSGPANTQVTVDGTGFTGATVVKFGSTPGTALTVVSDTRLRVRAPAGSGTVNLRVTTAGGVSAVVTADRFTYVS